MLKAEGPRPVKLQCPRTVAASELSPLGKEKRERGERERGEKPPDP